MFIFILDYISSFLRAPGTSPGSILPARSTRHVNLLKIAWLCLHNIALMSPGRPWVLGIPETMTRIDRRGRTRNWVRVHFPRVVPQMSTYLVSRGTESFSYHLSFQGCLLNREPWGMDTVSPSGQRADVFADQPCLSLGQRLGRLAYSSLKR